MDETETLPVVMKALSVQSVQQYRLWVCVNQPDEWWVNDEKRKICERNASTLLFLARLQDPRITIIDKSSAGNGWKGKNHGIGWARKILMDSISERADQQDLIVSMDADTVFGEHYLESILSNAELNPKAVAFSIPYYHPLSGNDELDRVILRYEIYMRAYAINLFRIGNPYCFTALGSAIALPVWAYRAIGGITPKLSGEDFYFLQKLVKFGELIHWNSEMVYPAGRLSNRVYFGTGPALIKGLSGDWDSYPVYSIHLFEKIRETNTLFTKLYEQDEATPVDSFLEERMGGLPWALLRKNSKTKAQFIRACHEKLDGLRILQFLKESNRIDKVNDEQSALELVDWIVKNQSYLDFTGFPERFDFSTSPVKLIDSLRNLLAQSEMDFRRQHWDRVSGLTPILN